MVSYASLQAHLHDAGRPLEHFPGAEDIQDAVLCAAIASGVVSSAHLFTDRFGVPPRDARLQRLINRGRIEWKPLSALPELVAQQSYICVSTDAMLNSVLAVRAGLNGTFFPVCSVLHRVPTMDLLGWLIQISQRIRSCDAVVTTSHAARMMLESTWNIVLEQHRPQSATDLSHTLWIEEVACPIDVDTFRPQSKEYCRRALELPAEKTIVLCDDLMFGSHGGATPLLSVLADAFRVHRQAILCVVKSEASANATIEAVARDHGLAGVVVCRDNPSVEVSSRLYGSADIFLSLDDRVAAVPGLRILEAMSSGLPVIASDWCDARDMIRDRVNGILVPTYWDPIADSLIPWLQIGRLAADVLAARTIIDLRCFHEALTALLSQPEHRQSLGANARRHVLSHHSYDTAGHSLGDLWNRQLARCLAMPRQNSVSRANHLSPYRYYATDTIRMETAVAMSARGVVLRDDELRGCCPRAMPPMLRSDAMILLEATRGNTPTVRECVGLGSELSYEALLWLLKSGYLDIVRPEQVPSMPSLEAHGRTVS